MNGWAISGHVFELERQEPENGRAKAVVIFCQYRGAIRHLARHLKSETFTELNLRIHTPTLPEEETSQHSIPMHGVWSKLKKISS